MNWQKWTKLFIGILIAIIAVWDVYVIVKGGTEASISYTIRKWSHEFPAFTFAMGFVMGHLFWGMRKTVQAKVIEKWKDIKQK